TLRPDMTRLHITSIDLDADSAGGKVIVEDGVVWLEDIQGQTADGLLRTEASLDFRARPAELSFDVQAEHLDLRQLPRKWALPPSLAIRGRLDGHAHIVVRVLDGKAGTSGDGAGTITDARIAGMTLRRPIPLRLHADGKRF